MGIEISEEYNTIRLLFSRLNISHRLKLWGISYSLLYSGGANSTLIMIRSGK